MSWRDRLRGAAGALVADPLLVLTIALLLAAGLATVYSAAADFPGRFALQLRNVAVAVGIMALAANVPPQRLRDWAPAVYGAGVALLLAVFVAGVSKKGAQRWLHVGIDIQPSELMKIAMPLMLAWFFHQFQAMRRSHAFAVAAVLLAVPVGLIMKQPDLGTALLVLAAGCYVIVLAGLSWRAFAGLALAAIAAVPLAWPLLHDYQRNRVLTLLDPASDPLGKGFQIKQAGIAIGSGGLQGKGWLAGTQGHLGFVPERSTDFIFSVFAEEFGLLGNVALLALYGVLIVRGLRITAGAATRFSRLLAGAVTMILFTYVFINIGMVCAIFPVVGVPLPFFSYGGTALMTLGVGCGILLAIRHESAALAHRF
ncbi:rod shape determining protein RodA [Pseudoduganella flava]|uniref:Peptidoglycan glycosyltransferase MrdB n=1 Tax=Pseudoduganella flava TaxID=871742 RepID=A0A562Q014_9BURK|nr:rod shape-determining protein RodA [Pseudoduganella flava]QGZ38462.1 rod shape-determining protein RodA [Pseudoduganella flava]TWI49988.1 rod shape determining protein RodA [Pseudoduganella flava]